MDVKSLHVQSVACPRMRTLVLQTMDFQSIAVDLPAETDGWVHNRSNSASSFRQGLPESRRQGWQKQGGLNHYQADR